MSRVPRRILVTGATGFIGSHLAKALLQQGDFVRAIGRDPIRLAELQVAGCEVMHCDLRDVQRLRDACDDIDVVCHAAALSSPWGRWREFHEHNVLGTKHVIRGSVAAGVKRLVYVSSPSVTSGRGDIQDQDEDASVPNRAISLYSLSKRMGEALVQQANSDSLETVTIRPKAVFGPGDKAILPRLIRAAAANKLVQIGTGKNRVDLTFIDNVVHAIALATVRPEIAGETFLITNDEHPLLWSVISRVCRELGHRHQFRAIPYHVAYAAATMMELRARVMGNEPLLTRYSVTILAKSQTYNIRRAKQLLGYHPVVSIEQGIERTLQSLAREHKS